MGVPKDRLSYDSPSADAVIRILAIPGAAIEYDAYIEDGVLCETEPIRFPILSKASNVPILLPTPLSKTSNDTKLVVAATAVPGTTKLAPIEKNPTSPPVNAIARPEPPPALNVGKNQGSKPVTS